MYNELPGMATTSSHHIIILIAFTDGTQHFKLTRLMIMLLFIALDQSQFAIVVRAIPGSASEMFIKIL